MENVLRYAVLVALGCMMQVVPCAFADEDAASVDAQAVLSELSTAADQLQSAGNSSQAKQLRDFVEQLSGQVAADGHVSKTALDELADEGEKFGRMVAMWRRTSATRADALQKASETVAAAVGKLRPLVVAPAPTEAPDQVARQAGEAAAQLNASEVIVVTISSSLEQVVGQLAETMGQAMGEALSQAAASVQTAPPAPASASRRNVSDEEYARSREAMFANLTPPGSNQPAQPQMQRPAPRQSSRQAGQPRQVDIAVGVKVGPAEARKFGSSKELDEYLQAATDKVAAMPVIFDIKPEVSWAEASKVINIFSESKFNGVFSFASLKHRSVRTVQVAAPAGGLPVVPAGPLPDDLAR